MLTHGRDSSCGDVLIKRASACGEEHVSVDAAELLAVFGDAGGAPAQRHLPALPVLHVARVGAAVRNSSSETSGDVTRRERSFPFT